MWHSSRPIKYMLSALMVGNIGIFNDFESDQCTDKYIQAINTAVCIIQNLDIRSFSIISGKVAFASTLLSLGVNLASTFLIGLKVW